MALAGHKEAPHGDLLCPVLQDLHSSLPHLLHQQQRVSPHLLTLPQWLVLPNLERREEPSKEEFNMVPSDLPLHATQQQSAIESFPVSDQPIS